MIPQNTPLYLVNEHDNATRAVSMVVGWTGTGVGTHLPVTVPLDADLADTGYAAAEHARFPEIPDVATVYYTATPPEAAREQRQRQEMRRRITEKFTSTLMNDSLNRRAQ